MKAIEIKNLNHTYDSDSGIYNINLTIYKHDFCVIAGCNGSGKTTLLRHLNGLLSPDKGDVRIYGKAVKNNLMFARRNVGMVFQDADMQIIGETVEEDIAFGPENLNMPVSEIKKRVMSALTVTGLTEKKDKNPVTLSGGEKRKLAIADVISMDASILVFDEPFANLDYPGTVKILKQILYLHDNGHTIIIATHDIEKVIYHAGRLVIMNRGSLEADGKPEEVMNLLEKNGIKKPCSLQYGYGLKSWLI